MSKLDNNIVIFLANSLHNWMNERQTNLIGAGTRFLLFRFNFSNSSWNRTKRSV